MARVFITGSSDGLGLMAAKLLIEQGHASCTLPGEVAMANYNSDLISVLSYGRGPGSCSSYQTTTLAAPAHIIEPTVAFRSLYSVR